MKSQIHDLIKYGTSQTLKEKQEAKRHLVQRTAILRTRLTGPHKRVEPSAIQHAIKSFFTSIYHMLFFRHGRLSTPMCQNYGHCIQGQQWKSSGIYCRDCGAKVTAADQLRKAMPREVVLSKK